jgi:hypothetical protein
MADFWGDLLKSLSDPKVAGGVVSGLGTLIDPAKPTTTTTSNQTTLPSYIAPYAGRMLDRAESLSQEGYTPYGGQRIADFTAPQQQAFSNIMGQQLPNQQAYADIASTAAHRMLDQPTQWNSTIAGQYMSPYMQGVTDIAKREATKDFNGTIMPGISGMAAQRGAFGGSRQALLESEATNNFGNRLSDIQTKGLQDAYTSGMGQFNADRSATTANLAYAPGAAATGANIAQQGFQNQNTQNQGLMGIGALQQGQQQAGLDMGYQDFLRQQQQPYQQTQFMQSFLQGLPMTQYATATTNPAPSMTQQLIGNTMAGYYGLGSLFPQQPKTP